jgi:chromosome segregation ATPase
MKQNFNYQNYSYDYSDANLNLRYDTEPNKYSGNLHSARIVRNNSYISKTENINNINKFRINNLEGRISSLEKMLQYLDEFIHLKEEEKTENKNKNNLLIEPLLVKINILEKDIQNLQKEKEENKKTISELNDKIYMLEKKLNNVDYNGIQDIIYSLSDKEKKLNMLINDFSDMTKDNDILINNRINGKFNEFNILNENRINELLVLIQDTHKIIEENETKINKINNSIKKTQKDNIDIIKYISIQSQKFNSLEIIFNEIKNLKEKFNFLMGNSMYDKKKEMFNMEFLK